MNVLVWRELDLTTNAEQVDRAIVPVRLELRCQDMAAFGRVNFGSPGGVADPSVGVMTKESSGKRAPCGAMVRHEREGLRSWNA